MPKAIPKPAHRNTTQTGDFSEAAFLFKATSLGFGVAKPWSNSERYDFILDNGSRLWRVQLKCTASLRARGYDLQPIRAIYGKSKLAYTEDDVDALVAHIVPVDAWCCPPHRRHNQPEKPPLLPRQQLPPRPLRKLPRSLGIIQTEVNPPN